MSTYIILNAYLQYFKKYIMGGPIRDGLSKKPSLKRICAHKINSIKNENNSGKTFFSPTNTTKCTLHSPIHSKQCLLNNIKVIFIAIFVLVTHLYVFIS